MLTIEVKGESGSGKTRAAMVIRKALEAAGYVVTSDLQFSGFDQLSVIAPENAKTKNKEAPNV